MQPLEWREIAKRIIAKWPHQVPSQASLAESFDALGDLEAEPVMVAVESFYRDGERWPPTGGMLRQRVMELALDAPDWGEVFRCINAYVRTGICNPVYGGFESYQARGEGQLERMPTAIAAFIRSVGNRQLFEASEQEGGGEARLRDKWLAWSGRQTREAALFGLPTGGLRSLERINRRGPLELGVVLREALPEVAGE